jgi:hypothetical protein
LAIAPSGLAIVRGAEPLPGTAPLESAGDLSLEVVNRVDLWFLSQTARRQEELAKGLPRTPEDRQQKRERLKRILGLTKDPRVADPEGEFVGSLRIPFVVAESDRVRVLALRWPVLEGVEGEGLLLEPLRGAVANVIALPDADQAPELIAGVGTAAAELDFAWARRLAEGGCRVLIPALLDRRNDFSGNPRVAQTNQSHREWVYRQAYYLGRHVAGYEIHKVLAAADVLQSLGQAGATAPPLILAGYGEGGWIALLSAAVDPRFSRLLVSGAWGPLADVWQQPIDRNVWSLVRDFRAADLLDLAGGTHVLVEAGQWPEVTGPGGPHSATRGCGCRVGGVGSSQPDIPPAEGKPAWGGGVPGGNDWKRGSAGIGPRSARV